MTRGAIGPRILVLPATADDAAGDWLLPAAAVAEIVRLEGLAPPAPGAADWLIGTLDWRGVTMPAVRLGRPPAPPPAPAAGQRARQPRPYLVVCLGLTGRAALPFFAIEAPCLPRLEQVAAEDLAEDRRERPGALATLRLNGRPAALVDLESVERRLLAARAGG